MDATAAATVTDHAMRGTAIRPLPLRRNLRFQTLWIGMTASTVGVSVADVAYPLIILAMTGSPAARPGGRRAHDADRPGHAGRRGGVRAAPAVPARPGGDADPGRHRDRRSRVLLDQAPAVAGPLARRPRRVAANHGPDQTGEPQTLPTRPAAYRAPGVAATCSLTKVREWIAT